MDLYAEMRLLLDRRSALDQRIAPLLSERSVVETKIKTVAAAMAGDAAAISDLAAEPATQPISEGEEEDNEAELLQHQQDLARQAWALYTHLPPRRQKLLRYLHQRPEAETGELAEYMYGKDSRSCRNALSAEFSGLKSAGFVEPLGPPGRFRLTNLARRALAMLAGGMR